MAFDREEFEVFRQTHREASHHGGKVNGSRADLEHFVQAQVRMENLTGDADWDLFLQYLQAGCDKAEAEAAQLETRLMDPMTVNMDEIMAVKIALARNKGYAEAVRAVLSLPADIKKTGEQAKDLLSRSGDG